MSDRYIPSLERLQMCARELPNPGIWKEDTCQIPVGNGRALTFRKVKFKVTGGKDFKWIYEGKVRIEANGKSESSSFFDD